MNIETANRLLAYRKRFGYSQEQLAEKLGISRQAVSKWERAEASPDTDNLIELAKLYGVSLDALVRGDADVTAADTEKEAPSHVEIKESPVDAACKSESAPMTGEENDDDDDDEETERENGIRFKRSNGDEVYFPTGMMATIALFVFGFALDAWHPAWMGFLLIPIVGSLSDCVRMRSIKPFAYPIFCTVVFLLLGFYAPNGWVWSWLVYLTIPIWHPFTALFDRSLSREETEENKDK